MSGTYRRRAAIALLVLVAALPAFGCGGDGGDDAAKPRLVVSAAASLQAAFTKFGKRFPDADVRFSFAGSDQLAAQIRQGVKPDVFAAANTRLPDALYVEKLVEKPIRFASNELVLAVRAGNTKIHSLDDIKKRGVRIAIGAPAVPVGAYTRTVFDQLPRADSEAILANVRSEEPDVTGIVGKIAQGAVDAGFVYVTDVRAAKGKLEQIELPDTVQPVVEYGVAIVKGAKQPLLAKVFIYELLNGEGNRQLTGEGFGAPPSGPV